MFVYNRDSWAITAKQNCCFIWRAFPGTTVLTFAVIPVIGSSCFPVSIIADLFAKFCQANAATGHNKAENEELFTSLVVKSD